ncbi:sulfurtransferase [Corynebacterium sp.]|uniref:sulfurtransferase n=1 Tax=Corynebacterium sp. TaxID=1720 RepID=UPI0025BC28A4|nr:sulfurtransferase [Corynebacterium sp.]
MGIELDPSPNLRQYAHPGKLVTSSWLGAKLGGPGLKVVESDSDPILYNIGHLPTAIRIDLHEDLGDPVTRDFLDGEAFARLMDSKGITRDDTVVLYGDDSNLWASYTLWVFELFGHPDVRLLDGGREAWMQDERETSYDAPPAPTSGYPVVERDDTSHRIFVDEVRSRHDELQLIDLRDPEDFIGVHRQGSGGPAEDEPSDYTAAVRQIPVCRAGHIPGAVNVPQRATLHPNHRFRTRGELDEVFSGLDPAGATVPYCHAGERAAHLWFVLHHLLGWEDVRAYDGSWVEWGNMVRMPIATGG